MGGHALDTSRCLLCDQPVMDHTPFRYWWAAWWRHALLRLVSKPLTKIQDPTAPF